MNEKEIKLLKGQIRLHEATSDDAYMEVKVWQLKKVLSIADHYDRALENIKVNLMLSCSAHSITQEIEKFQDRIKKGSVEWERETT